MKIVKNLGFTIIELLISIFILSVGILSYNYLQMHGLNATFKSYKEEVAIQNIRDFSEFSKQIILTQKKEENYIKTLDFIQNSIFWDNKNSCEVLINNDFFNCQMKRNYEDISMCDLNSGISYSILSFQCEQQKMIKNSRTNFSKCSDLNDNYCIYTYWNTELKYSVEDCSKYSTDCVVLEVRL